MKERGKICGAGAYLYINNHSEFKFSQKNLKQMLSNNMEFKQLFLQECRIALEEFLQEPDNTKRNIDNDINDGLLEMICSRK